MLNNGIDNKKTKNDKNNNRKNESIDRAASSIIQNSSKVKKLTV